MADLKFTQDGTEYTFDPETLTTMEAIELKKLTGLNVMQWLDGVGQMDAESFRVLVWLARKRAGNLPDGRYSEFDFPLLEVASTFDVDGVEEEESDPTPAAI